MTKNNKKIIAIAGVGGTAALLAFGTALALFTDNDTDKVGGTAGTVDVELNKFALSNPDNINPGDYDPDMPVVYVPTEGDPLFDPENPDKEVEISTTKHDLTFSITNNGTKSIRTRHTLVLSVKDSEGKALDARVFQLYEDKDDTTSLPAAEDELTGKIYVAEDGKEYTALADIPEDALISSIVYRFTPDIFDGVGLQAEVEENSTVKSDGKVAASQDYLYKLAMDMESPNEYQGASISVETVIEAMQYRNTVQDDWTIVETEVFEASVAGTDRTAVPAR